MDCCTACTTGASCTHWTFDIKRLPKACNLKVIPSRMCYTPKTHNTHSQSGHSEICPEYPDIYFLCQGGSPPATGQPNPDCTSGIPQQPPTPPPPPSPPIPPPAPPNPSAARPHLLFVLADDLGFYDTQVYNPASPTPKIAALSNGGVRLDRHCALSPPPLTNSPFKIFPLSNAYKHK